MEWCDIEYQCRLILHLYLKSASRDMSIRSHLGQQNDSSATQEPQWQHPTAAAIPSKLDCLLINYDSQCHLDHLHSQEIFQNWKI